ncbi:App1 family protein [soil metagenome]
MPDSRNPIARLASRAGGYLDRNTLRPRPLRPPSAPLLIEAYLGHGTPDVLYVKGRVREDNGIREAAPEDSRLRNLRSTWRRVTRREARGVRVRASFQGIELETLSNRAGFFDFEIEPPGPLPAGRVWHEVELSLVDPPRQPPGGVRATARVLVPPASADFGIISDIDDTVVRTDVTNWLRMLRIVLLTNAHTRLPFDHVDTLYRALQLGPRGTSYNPIFYVSSSPWSFYDLLEHFFRAHDIPAGPIFLKTYTFSRQHLQSRGHHSHKLRWIRMLFDTHPDLDWVLIGDSGQQDPEIYREAVREYPGRVRAIYIRDVTTPARDREVHAIADEVAAMGVEMRLVEETVEAGEHAAANGLITPEALAAMRAEEAEDAAEGGILARVVGSTI